MLGMCRTQSCTSSATAAMIWVVLAPWLAWVMESGVLLRPSALQEAVNMSQLAFLCNCFCFLRIVMWIWKERDYSKNNYSYQEESVGLTCRDFFFVRVHLYWSESKCNIVSRWVNRDFNLTFTLSSGKYQRKNRFCLRKWAITVCSILFQPHVVLNLRLWRLPRTTEQPVQLISELSSHTRKSKLLLTRNEGPRQWRI